MTDDKGYLRSLVTENKNNDDIMIVNWTPVEKPPLEKLRDLSKGE